MVLNVLDPALILLVANKGPTNSVAEPCLDGRTTQPKGEVKGVTRVLDCYVIILAGFSV